jgi:hypothetical protein
MGKGKGNRDDDREQRLAEALRANLKRRKEQARAAQNTRPRDEKPSD